MLDWLPAALIMLAFVFHRTMARSGWLDMFKLLVVWGMVLNVVTVAVLALSHGG